MKKKSFFPFKTSDFSDNDIYTVTVCAPDDYRPRVKWTEKRTIIGNGCKFHRRWIHRLNIQRAHETLKEHHEWTGGSLKCFSVRVAQEALPTFPESMWKFLRHCGIKCMRNYLRHLYECPKQSYAFKSYAIFTLAVSHRQIGVSPLN